MFLPKHNHITSTFYFICTFKRTKRCSFRLKIIWYVVWAIFRFAQCLEWLLNQPSYLSTMMFLQRKSRRGLKLNRCPLYSIKVKNAYSYVSVFFLSSWRDNSAQGEFMLPFFTESCLITGQAFRSFLKQTFKIILPISAPVA